MKFRAVTFNPEPDKGDSRLIWRVRTKWIVGTIAGLLVTSVVVWLGVSNSSETISLRIASDPPGAGSFLLDPGPLPQGGYARDTTVTIDALPNQGWRVKEWVGEVEILRDRSARIRLNSSKIVVVRFLRLTDGPSGPLLQPQAAAPGNQTLPAPTTTPENPGPSALAPMIPGPLAERQRISGESEPIPTPFPAFSPTPAPSSPRIAGQPTEGTPTPTPGLPTSGPDLSVTLPAPPREHTVGHEGEDLELTFHGMGSFGELGPVNMHREPTSRHAVYLLEVDFVVANTGDLDIASDLEVLIMAMGVGNQTMTLGGNLSAGSNKSFTSSWSSPTPCYNPECIVRIVVDPANRIQELDENNNTSERRDGS